MAPILPPKPEDKRQPKKQQPRNLWSFLGNVGATFLIFFAVLALYSLLSDAGTPAPETISISTLAQDISKGLVKTIDIKGDELDLTYQDGTNKISKKETDLALSQTLVNYGVTSAKINQVSIEVQKQSGWLYWTVQLAPIVIPVICIAIFIWFLMRQAKGSGVQAFSFGQSKARISFPGDKKQKVTFKDVAGAKEAKQELSEIVDFLKNPKKFLEIGAVIPKGVLLMGAPGTGKTLLARAVAGEANVAFFSISGSEFVEMFVGVGASRVRDLFKMAKAAAPAIIFVDEIDAVGRVRGTGVGGGNDEREQTLNQILVEMDGFEPNEKVIVMAATNRPDVLDPALLRPGRFDRRVVIDLPDRGDREEILKIHGAKKPFAEDVNLKVIAERTPGFSGADLYSLMNESAILAARENRNKVSQYDLIRAIEKVMLGPERKSHILSKQEKKITAYHEAGHAIVGHVLPDSDPVHKVTIIPRGGTGGVTWFLPPEDSNYTNVYEFKDILARAMGGRIAEEIMYGKDGITTGAGSDLRKATEIARDMVIEQGMGTKLRDQVFHDDNGGMVFDKMTHDRPYGEETARQIDIEVRNLVEEARVRAREVLIQNKKSLDILAKALLKEETLEEDRVGELLKNTILPKEAKLY